MKFGMLLLEPNFLYADVASYVMKNSVMQNIAAIAIIYLSSIFGLEIFYGFVCFIILRYSKIKQKRF